jgi:replicative DNA helicase
MSYNGRADGRGTDAEVIEERLPPHDVEAEAAVLGSILIDPDALYEVEGFLKPGDFYRSANRWVYDAILGMRAAGTPLDVVTLIGELKRREQLDEIGGDAALIDLLNAVPTSVNVEAYGRAVHAAAVRRGLLAAAGQIAKMAWDETRPVADVVGHAEQTLFAATADMTADGVVDARTTFDRLLDVTMERRSAGAPVIGVPSGLVDLDRITGGYKKAGLYLVAGRPGMGKSAFMTSNVAHICGKLGKRVALFTLEMTAEDQTRRLTTIESGVTYDQIERGQLSDDEWQRFALTAGRAAEWPLWIDDTPGITPTQLAAKARRLYAEHGLDVIFIDYLGLMNSDGQAWSENDRLGKLTGALKGLAKELSVPVVTLAQLSRAVEQRQDKRPQLADLRDSGNLEQDADAVIFLYRDDYYNKDTDRPNIAEADVAKHRNGRTGMAELFWNGHLMAFRNLQTREVKL